MRQALRWLGVLLLAAVMIPLTLFMIGLALRVVLWNIHQQVPTILDPLRWF